MIKGKTRPFGRKGLLVLTIIAVGGLIITYLIFFSNPVNQKKPNINSLQETIGKIIEISRPTEAPKLNKKYYVAVTEFSSTKENITFQELQDSFSDEVLDNYLLAGDETIISQILGGQTNTSVVNNTDELINNIDKTDLAIVPFDQLIYKLKVLKIDNKNILEKDYAGENWPLTTLTTEKSNRDPRNLTTLAMTGVTAISRGVEYAIQSRNDPIFPARGVMDKLAKADITHVNSETPFFDSCIPQKEGLVLCGRTASIEALKAIGTDVVDLAGNHQNDYGEERNLESISHLENAGFKYFGGGKNEQDAAEILFLETNHTKFAFTGYNYFDSLNGPEYRSLAYQDQPGANYYSEDKLEHDMLQARENADIVVVDFQFIEQYQTEPLASQKKVFRQAIDLGADIVVGVQAHQPQEVELYREGIIFYGLGNFFFDQMWSHETRQGIIPKFILYEGKLISVEILTTLLHDYAQPQFTTGEERTQLLKQILPN